jgi:hypothetical protein
VAGKFQGLPATQQTGEFHSERCDGKDHGGGPGGKLTTWAGRQFNAGRPIISDRSVEHCLFVLPKPFLCGFPKDVPERPLLIGNELDHLCDHKRQVNHEGLLQARNVADAELTGRQLFLLGRDLHLRGIEADTLASVEMLERAVQRDPDYAIAHAWLSFTVQRALTHGWGRRALSVAREESLASARRAVQLEPRSPVCLATLAFALALQGSWEEAVAAARSVVGIDRHAMWETWAIAGGVLTLAGHHGEAVRCNRCWCRTRCVRPRWARRCCWPGGRMRRWRSYRRTGCALRSALWPCHACTRQSRNSDA